MFRWKQILAQTIFWAVIGLMMNCSGSSHKDQNIGKAPVLNTTLSGEATKIVKEETRPIDTCLFRFIHAGSKVIKNEPTIYFCLDVLRSTPNPEVDSVWVYYWANCRAWSRIDSLIVYFKDKKQVLQFEYATVCYYGFENLYEKRYLKFVHCNNDNYLDLAVQSGRSGNGHAVVEILLYNNTLREFEYDTFLSNEGSLSYDRKKDIYQTYDRGGQSDFLFRRFRVEKGVRVIVEEMDVRPDWDRSNRDRTYVVFKHSTKTETIDTLCFIHSASLSDNEVHDRVWNHTILKKFHNFDKNFGIF